MKKLHIPAFRSEAAEARWWYEHFAQAGKAGTLKKLTREESLKRLSSRALSRSGCPRASSRGCAGWLRGRSGGSFAAWRHGQGDW